jgi:glycosyltransferase involved in cell wall biosynthesis
MKIAFVTNLPSHYMTRVFELLAQKYNIDFIFFSDLKEPWIDKKNIYSIGNYNGYFMKGVRISRHIKINIRLFVHLLTGRYDVFIQYINGPLELLSTFVVAKVLHKPFILWTDLWFHPDTLFHKLSFPLIRYVYRHSNAIAVWGIHVARYLVSLGVQEENIFYSWGSVDNDLFNLPIHKEVLDELRLQYHIENKNVLLFVGRLSKEKGLFYLLDAYNELRKKEHVCLFLIGHGTEKLNIQKYILKNTIPDVYLLDYIDNKNLITYYALADILVLPSIQTRTYREVWGLVINEAMNQGCAIVATDIVGAAIGGLIENNNNGIVVREQDAVELYNALRSIVGDPQLLNSMKKSSLARIRDWDSKKCYSGFVSAINYVQNNIA